MNKLGFLLFVLVLLTIPTLSRGAVQGTLVSQSPGITVLSVPTDTIMVVSVTYRNTGTVILSNIVGNAGYVELCSTNQAGNQLVASPLGINWLSTSSIVKTTGSVLCTGGAANAANSAHLHWTAVGDDSMSGRATRYDIRAGFSALTAVNWGTAMQLAAPPTPAASGTPDSATFTGLTPSTTYYFGVRAIDDANNIASVSNSPSATTATVSYTFLFSIKAPSVPGQDTLYIGLLHPGSGTIVSAPGPKIVLDVHQSGPVGSDVEAFIGQLGGNRYDDIMLYDRSVGQLSVAIRDSTANRFSVLSAPWSSGYLSTLGPHSVFLLDYSGDGLADVVVWEWNKGRIHGARNLGTSNGFAPFQVLVDLYHATSDSAQFDVKPGFFNSDNKADLVFVDKYQGLNFVLASTGTTFVQVNGPGPNGSWNDEFAACPDPFRYQVLAEDLDNDHRTDLVYIDWMAGDVFSLRSSGSSFDFVNGPNPYGASLHDYGASTDQGYYQWIAGDFNGDQLGDLLLRAPDEARVYGVAGTGTAFVPVNGPGAMGSLIDHLHALDTRDRYRVLRAQETADIKDDLLIWDRQQGLWTVAQAGTNAFQLVAGANASGSWIDRWGPMTALTSSQTLGVGSDSIRVSGLQAVYPNPCRTSSTIRYAVPQSTHITLCVYDVSGRVIDRLVDQEQQPGQYTVRWRPTASLVSGMYFIRLSQANHADVQKIAHLR